MAICIWLFATRPEPRKWPQRESIPEVEVQRMVPVDYQVLLDSQGTVQARTESNLLPEVQGRVLAIGANFRAGSFFEKGEILLEIDPSDYETDVVVAQAALAQAELALEEERAEFDIARQNWETSGNTGAPTAFALREPQLRLAEANVASARARLERAKLNLERTRVVAPYDGRILDKNVDVGQVVSGNTVLARIYAVDYAEVRLPLSERQLQFLELSEAFRGESTDPGEAPKVYLTWELGRQQYEWIGRLVRSEGAIDTASRQLFVVAQVDDPYGRTSEGIPLKVGSFVQARIEGRLLEKRFVIPREMYRKNEYVLMVSREKTLERRGLDIEWSTETDLVVANGMRPGDLLCLTPINFPVDGMKVDVIAIDGKNMKREVDWNLVPEALKEEFETARANRDFAKLKELQAQLEPYMVVGGAGDSAERRGDGERRRPRRDTQG